MSQSETAGKNLTREALELLAEPDDLTTDQHDESQTDRDPETDLPTPATRLETPTSMTDPATGRPRQLGPYRLLEVLGEGGMGRVFLAEQSEPVRRQVALKILRFAIASDQLKARFDAERHAMSRLDHPNIGKLLEAGTTDEGAPFFAMELIDGEPITRYCDRKSLAIEDRLRIFVDVCRGTAHAHSRLDRDEGNRQESR